MLLAVLLIIIAFLSAAARIGLPLLAGQKSALESRLSEYLHSPVNIGELSLRWRTLGPQLRASDVDVTEADDRQVNIDELLIDVNFAKSFWRRTLVINELTLVGANLSLEYAGEGEFHLRGIGSTSSAPESAAGASNQDSTGVDLLAWLLNADQVALLDSHVTLIDAERGQHLLIDKLNIRAENNGLTHQLRIDMQLPKSLGGELQMGVDLSGAGADVLAMSADVYINANDLRAGALRAWDGGALESVAASTTGIAPLDASVQLALWGHFEAGVLQTARGQISARSIVDTSTNALVLDRLTSDLTFLDQPSGWKIEADSVELQSGSDVTSIDDVVFAYKPDAHSTWQLDAHGDRLPLALASRLVAAMFTQKSLGSVHQWLEQSHVTGDLQNWRTSVALRDQQPDLSLHGTYKGVSMLAAGQLPGVSELSGAIAIVHNKGAISLQAEQFKLDAPQLYKTPLTLAMLNGELALDISNLQRATLSGQVTVRDDGLEAVTRLAITLSPDESPLVDLHGRFSMQDVGQTKKYIPTKLFRKRTTTWLNQAFVSGRANNGELLLFGHLDEFPYSDQQGVFKVGFDVSDLTLDYFPGWPEVTDLEGHVEFNEAALSGRATAGRIKGVRVGGANARIADLRDAQLDLSATAGGKLQELIRFANTGPLKSILRPALVDASGTGDAQLDLKLHIPLRKSNSVNPRHLQVSGSVFLKDNTLSFARSGVSFEHIRGAIGFTESGLRINNLEARFLSQNVSLNSQASGIGKHRVTEIAFTGVLDADTALQHYNIPLQRFVEGKSNWKASLYVPMNSAVVRQHGIQLSIESDLIGTQLLLPAPLRKTSAVPSKLRLQSTLREGVNNSEWFIDYGQQLKARVLVDQEGLQALSVNLGGGAANSQLVDGVRIDGKATSLAIDGWVSSIAELLRDLPTTDAPSRIMAVSADLRIDSMLAGVQSLGSAQLRVNSDSSYLNLVIDSPVLRGNLRYPREHWRKDIPLKARIAFADKQLIDALQSGPENTEPRILDPRLLPPIEARIARFKWGQLDMHDVTLRTTPDISGVKIDALGFAYQTTQLIGEGYWRLRDPQAVNPVLKDEHISQLSLTLQSDDIGQGLTELGFSGTIDEGEGVVRTTLVWPGPVYNPDLATIAGTMQIDLARGRILKVDPGAARLVGLFALQTLPRRLSLDFKDLVSEGLDFDRIDGELQLAEGVVDSSLVQLNGPVGVIDITGESNLLTREYDQKITVLPRVSAALPIIGAISGGATAGIGALIAGGFLKAIGLDLDRIGLREYRLVGSWDAPELLPVPQASGPAPD